MLAYSSDTAIVAGVPKAVSIKTDQHSLCNLVCSSRSGALQKSILGKKETKEERKCQKKTVYLVRGCSILSQSYRMSHILHLFDCFLVTVLL